MIIKIYPDAISTTFLQAGRGIVDDNTHKGAQNGWIHHKTVPYTIIAQATRGQYSITTADGRIADCAPGEAFLTAPDTPLAITHHCDGTDGIMRMRYIHFNFLLFGSVNLATLAPLPLRVPAVWADRFGDAADALYDIQQKYDGSLLTAARTKSIGYTVLEMLLKFLEEQGIRPEINPALLRLLPALALINRALVEKLSVERLAAEASLSAPHFHAEFRKAVGCPPLEYVRNQRLTVACDRLRSGTETLEEIAQGTGFYGAYHLSREFKKKYGMPPGEFRRRFSDGLTV